MFPVRSLAMLTLWMCAGLYLFWPLGHVRADVVGPAPEDCPPAGTEGDSDHHGQYCRASVCAADSECMGGRVCREHPLCVEDRKLEHRRGNTYRSQAYGECGAGQQCRRGKCVVARRCVPPDFGREPDRGPPQGGANGAEPSPNSPDGSRGCGVGEPRGGSGLGLVAGLALAGWRRRRVDR